MVVVVVKVVVNKVVEKVVKVLEVREVVVLGGETREVGRPLWRDHRDRADRLDSCLRGIGFCITPRGGA